MSFYVLIVAVAASMFVSSCGKPDYPAVLTRADSLCEVYPQEAERLLVSVAKDTATMSSDARWYYRLLRLKSADKNYIAPRSNKEAFSVVAHYENGGDSRLLPQAYYYAASVCRDLNDAPQALDFFNKAEELLPEGENLKMRSMINNQSGHILSEQGFYDDALLRLKKSYRYDVALKDTENVIYSLRDIGYALSRKKSFKVAADYLQKSIRLARKANRSDLVRDVLIQYSGMLVDAGKYDKALDIMSRVSVSTKYIDSSPDYATLSDAYMGINQFDSTYKYSIALFSIGTVYAKKSASKNMIAVFSHKNNVDSVRKYINLYELYSDSVEKIETREDVSRNNALFNYNKYVKADAKLKLEQKRTTNIFLFVIAVLATIGCVAIGIALRINVKRKRQYRILGQMKKQQYEQTKEFREENDREILRLENQLQQYKGKNEELAALLERQKNELVEINRRSEKVVNDRKQKNVEFMKTDIYELIEKKLSVFKNNPKSGKPLSREEFQMLDETVNLIVKSFKIQLFSMTKLSLQEYHICLLVRMGLSVVETSQLIGLTTSAVSVARKRLYKKMTGEDGTGVQLDEIVNSL